MNIAEFNAARQGDASLKTPADWTQRVFDAQSALVQHAQTAGLQDTPLSWAEYVSLLLTELDL